MEEAEQDRDLGDGGLDPAASGERAPGRGDIDTIRLGATGGLSPAKGESQEGEP